MNKFTLRIRVLITLCFFCTSLMLFAGGGGQQQQQRVGADGRPILQIGIQNHTNVIDHKDNYLTRYLENMHNVNLEFEFFPAAAADARTRISLLAASNDLPETIWGTFMTQLQIMDLGMNGFLLPLNDLFNDSAKTPFFNQIPREDRDRMLSDTRGIDGRNYAFPQFEPDAWGMTWHRYYVNRSWLTTLGLQEPRTTNDLRNVLIAFRDRDPNGNGRQDEIGVFGGAEDVVMALMNSFVYWFRDRLALDATGNNVTAPFTETGFRQGLQYLNGLFRDGLFDASTFTNDVQTFRAVVNTQPMVVGFTAFGSVGNFPDHNYNPSYNALAPMLPPLTGPNGISYAPFNEYLPAPIAFITNNARNVDLAAKVMDSFYDENTGRVARFGEAEVHWSMNPTILAQRDNAFTALGIYPSVTLVVLDALAAWVQPHSVHWQNTNPRYVPQEFTHRISFEQFNPDFHASVHNGLNYQLYYPRRPQHLLPRNLPFSTNDGTTVAQISTDINEYVNQSVAEFIVGTRDINNDAAWNAYLSNLESMGLQRWISLTQTAYNQYRR